MKTLMFAVVGFLAAVLLAFGALPPDRIVQIYPEPALSESYTTSLGLAGFDDAGEGDTFVSSQAAMVNVPAGKVFVVTDIYMASQGLDDFDFRVNLYEGDPNTGGTKLFEIVPFLNQEGKLLSFNTGITVGGSNDVVVQFEGDLPPLTTANILVGISGHFATATASIP